MIEKAKKSSKIRVILLKDMPPKKHFYQSYEINEDLCKKVSLDKRQKKYKQNHTSIAYLSSILQDENSLVDQKYDINTGITDQSGYRNTYEVNKLNKIQRQDKKLQRMISLTCKQDERQLSCIIQSNQRQHNRFHRSKTQTIDKIIADRKIMPIDKLKIGSKNINFSFKNKQQLSKDFKQFISKNQQKNNIESRNQTYEPTLFTKKRQANNKRNFKYIWQKRMRTQLKNDSLVNSPDRHQQFSPKKQIRSQQKGFACQFKKMATNIPNIDNFGWSKVDQISFTLSK